MSPQPHQHSNLLKAKRILNVGLLWHSVYSANMGVNALTYAMLRYLEEVAEQLDIQFNYTILGYGVKNRDGCTDAIKINGKQISFKFERVPVPGIVNVRRPHDWLILLRWLVSKSRLSVSRLSKYDLILDIGEGDSFSDIYGSGRFIRMSLSKVVAMVAGKAPVLLPQTIGPFNHFGSRIIANQLMRQIRYIYPRDQASLYYLQKAIPRREFREYLDVAFYLPYERTCFTPEKTHIGLNISALLWQGGYTQDNMFKLQVNYQQLMRHLIQFFLEQDNVVVHLVPHVVASNQEDDYAVTAQIHQEMPKTILAPIFKTPIEAKSYISGLDFFAGARMHSCIAAYSSDVPVVPMAYSRKFSGLFLSTLKYPLLADLQHDNQEQAYQKICDGFKQRAVLRQAILAQRSLIENEISAFRRELVTIVREVYERQIT